MGAVPKEAVAGALTFRGPADRDAFGRVLADLEAGSARRLVFALPGGTAWPLPLYELALLTAAYLAAQGVRGADLTLVTPETAPLGIFGPEASDAVAKLLDERRVTVLMGRYPGTFADGELALVPEDVVEADRVVALPRLAGPAIAGIPTDASGFVPTDEHGRVQGVDDVYAAGDATTFPIKQGGLAAQQADAAAETIAARAGAAVTPAPFRAVLRGLLLTGAAPRFLRADLPKPGEVAFDMDTDPLWWPPSKIAGRYLAPFLAQHAGFAASSGPPPDGIPIEIDLSARIEKGVA